MTTVEKCDVWVIWGRGPSHVCGRPAKADRMCGLHLGVQRRQEAKAEAFRRAEAEQREARKEMQRRMTVASNLAMFLTDALRVQFEPAYGGVWMDTDQAEALLRIAQAKLL